LPDQHITTAAHPTKEIAAMRVNEAHDYLIHFIHTQVCSVTEYRTQNTAVKQESKWHRKYSYHTSYEEILD